MALHVWLMDRLVLYGIWWNVLVMKIVQSKLFCIIIIIIIFGLGSRTFSFSFFTSKVIVFDWRICAEYDDANEKPFKKLYFYSHFSSFHFSFHIKKIHRKNVSIWISNVFTILSTLSFVSMWIVSLWWFLPQNSLNGMTCSPLLTMQHFIAIFILKL